MIRKVPELNSFVSGVMTLCPGDVSSRARPRAGASALRTATASGWRSTGVGSIENDVRLI
jgi:hypothetical protein